MTSNRYRETLQLMLKPVVTVLLILALVLSAAAQEVSQSGLELKAARPMVEQPERAPKAMIASAN
ncbi:MAG TPA: hypothetical protein VG498_17275, partial [Terriglobales bacterium]|nr:hypothetical protein [Terriglobales bacterium]